MRALVAICAVSALDAFLRRPSNGTGASGYERNLPTQGTFLEKSHETIQHVRTDLKELFKTVGELRSSDLDEVSRQRQNFVGKLHAQEEEVRRQATANEKLQNDNAAILQAISGLEEQKKELVDENSQLEKRLKDLKGQVEQEVSGLETLLGGSERAASVLGIESAVGKADEESADDADSKDSDSDDAKDDDSKDDDSKDDSKDDDSKDDAKDDAKDDDKDDGKDDDSDDADDKEDDKDDDDSKQSLAKTGAKTAEKKSDKSDKTKTAAKADAEDKDDDSDDDAKDDDSDDGKDDEDDAPDASLTQVGAEEEPCHCTSACNKAAKPICFVQSASCSLKANCDKGAKGKACIKQDPVKGPWTFCSNVVNGTAPKETTESLLPENPNVAVALRMLADIKREITGITSEDDDGAHKLRESYRDEKATEEHKRKEVLDQQKELEQQQEDDLQRKGKLQDEVHSLQEKNKSLRRNVDRIGEFLKAESSKLSDAVTVAKSSAA